MDERFRLDEDTIALGRRRITEIRAQLRHAAGSYAESADDHRGDDLDGFADHRRDDRSEMIGDPLERVRLLRRIHELELENRRLRLQIRGQEDDESTSSTDSAHTDEPQPGRPSPSATGPIVDTPALDEHG